MVIPMNRAPRSPLITPRMIAAGRSKIEFYPIWVTSPNLSDAPSDIDKGEPIASDSRILNVKTDTDVAMNIFQSIVKVQKVLGFEIS